MLQNFILIIINEISDDMEVLKEFLLKNHSIYSQCGLGDFFVFFYL